MQKHFGYWSCLIDERKVVAFGPVTDPKGNYGIAIVEAADEVNAEKIASDDPAITANAGFRFELLPMPRLVRQA